MGQTVLAIPPRKEEGRVSAMQRHETWRAKIKVLVTMTIAVAFVSFGDVSLGAGMRIVGAMEHPTVLHAFAAAVTNLYIWAGIVMLLVFFALYLASLSWADLSYVVPLTAGEYVLATVLAHFFLHESIPPMRWAGSFLVAAGIAMVTRT